LTTTTDIPGDDLLRGIHRGKIISVLEVGMQHAVVLYLLEKGVVHLDELPGVMYALCHLEYRICSYEGVYQHQLYGFGLSAGGQSLDSPP